MKLNLGALDRKIDGFISVDICEPADEIVDLNGPWPWPDSSVDEIRAFDVFEHIGNCDHVSRWLCQRCVAARCGVTLTNVNEIYIPDPPPLPMRNFFAKVHIMNEMWRVMKPGGMAHIQVPDASEGDGAFCDPTHLSFWTSTHFEYFHPGFYERDRFKGSEYYGIKADFRVAGAPMKTRHPRRWGGFVVEINAVLEAIKP